MSAGKLGVRRTGSTPEVFSVMCCNGLVPVVLWCWCFVRWSSRHPTRRLRFKVCCSFPSDSHSSWGTEIESHYVGSKKESSLWTVFRENIMDKEFPQGDLNRIWYFRASLGVGAGSRVEAASMWEDQHVFQGSLTFSLAVIDSFVFQMHDLKMGQTYS